MRLLNSYRFLVFVGPVQIGFSKVTGLKSTVSFDSINEGGMNDYVHVVKAPVKQNGKLVFERGAYAMPVPDYYPGMRLIFPMTVILTTENGKIGRAFAVQNPVVEEWELSELDASSSSVVVEKFSVSHAGIENV